MDPKKKKDYVLDKARNQVSKSDATMESCIENFRKKTQEGPYYGCGVCNRALYKRSLMKFIIIQYPHQNCLTVKYHLMLNNTYVVQKSLKENSPSSCCKQFVCGWYSYKTCINWKARATSNSTVIVMKKIVVMPKGQQRKTRRAICNVPVFILFYFTLFYLKIQ